MKLLDAGEIHFPPGRDSPPRPLGGRSCLQGKRSQNRREKLDGLTRLYEDFDGGYR
ncbi:MAG TPA: hypothetical protein VFP23_09320 [Solirubrobacterales bacterium]|nr:hypothetical protein [Solirubrobacterales bacterium]